MEESPAAQQQHDQLLSDDDDDEDTVEFEIEVVTSSASSVTSRASTPKTDEGDDRLTGPTCERAQMRHVCVDQQASEEQHNLDTQTTPTVNQLSQDGPKATTKQETQEEEQLALEQEVRTNITASDVPSNQINDRCTSPNEPLQPKLDKAVLVVETNEEIIKNKLGVGSSLLDQQQSQHLDSADERIPLEHEDPQHDDNRKFVIEQSRVVESASGRDLSEDVERQNMTSLEVDCGKADLKKSPSCIFETCRQIELDVVDEPAQLLNRAIECNPVASTDQELGLVDGHARAEPPATRSDSVLVLAATTSGGACDCRLVGERIQWPPGWSLIDTTDSNEQVQLSAPLKVEPAKLQERPSIIKQTSVGQFELLSTDDNGTGRPLFVADSLAKSDMQTVSMDANDRQNKPLIRNTIDASEHVDSVATLEESPQQESSFGEVSVQLEGVPTVEVRSDVNEARQSSILADLEGCLAKPSGSSQQGDEEFHANSDDGQRLSHDGDHDDTSNVHAHSIYSEQPFSRLVLDKLSSSSSLHMLNSEGGSANLDDEDLEREFDEEPEFRRRNVQVKRNRNPRDEYELGAELGRGKFGTVVRCTELASGLQLAAKFIHMRRREDREDVEREVAIMSVLQHKRLLQLYDAFDDGHQEMCLITELVEGGELFERIVDDDFDLTEKKAAIFMRQICEGVEYMHGEQIVHLDMKPENILCLSRTGIRIKLIDFGLARRLDPQNPIRVLFGTPDFAAPEVLAYETVTLSTDMWSVGVICYVLLSGLSPFMGDSDIETMANVMRATYDFNDHAFEAISELAKDFISKLLVRDPEARLKPSDCLKHAWLQRGGAPLEAHIRDRRESSLSLTLSAQHRLALEQAAMLTSHAAAPTTPTSTTNSTDPTPPTPPSQLSAGSGPVPGPLAGLMSRVSFGAESISSVGHQSLDKRRLKKYVVRRKWHKTVHAIMALGRMGANLKLT